MELSTTQDHFDFEVDRLELSPGGGDAIFTLVGAGDLALCLLGARPKLVIAASAHLPQTYLLELKLAGLKALSHSEYLELLGARDSKRRSTLYARVRWLVSREADEFWTAHQGLIERGLLWQGRSDKQLGGFRRFLNFSVGRPPVERLLSLDDPGAQADLYAREWQNGFLWRKFGGGMLASALGWFDEEEALRRLEMRLTTEPARTNHFLWSLLLGRYEAACPFYLREDAFGGLKLLANRMIIVADPPEDYLHGLPDGSIDAFALGRGLDGVEEPQRGEILRHIVRVGREGARVAARTQGGDILGSSLFYERPVPRGGDRSLSPGRLVAGTLRSLARVG